MLKKNARIRLVKGDPFPFRLILADGEKKFTDAGAMELLSELHQASLALLEGWDLDFNDGKRR